MFSETRYARNGDLHVAYRTSGEGLRDIVFVSNWITNCEVFPELPSVQGWVEAMTSLGRLIFFDQPGTGASDPVTADEMPNMEQWADSITAVLDDLGSHEAVILAIDGAFAPAALFAATHPSRTTALVALECYADPLAETAGGKNLEEGTAAALALWGTGETLHWTNPDMPWNEEIRAAWARLERLTSSPRTVALMQPLFAKQDVRAVLPTIRVPTLVVHHNDDEFIPSAEIGDRDWHALLDAHDAVVRAQLVRFRGREVSTSGDAQAGDSGTYANQHCRARSDLDVDRSAKRGA